MKKIFIIIFMLFLFVNCDKNSSNTLEYQVDTSKLKFEPIPGGAKLKYTIPKSDDIYGISITYTNEIGEVMTVRGSYGAKEIDLIGFHNSKSSVAAEVSYIGMNEVKSEPTTVYFATGESGTISVFKNIKIEPYWSGFRVLYEAPKETDGFINIGFVGKNPLTGEDDILLKSSELIKPGKNILLFGDIVNSSQELSVVVWTEDFLSNEAKRKTYKVKPKKVVKIDSDILTYEGTSIEDPSVRIGKEYLFDGDSKGVRKLKREEGEGDFVFITSDPYISRPTGIIDMKSPQSVSQFRMYVPLNINVPYVNKKYFTPSSAFTANKFRIYLSNDNKAPINEWFMAGEFYQDTNISNSKWWSFPLWDTQRVYKYINELEEAEPCYCKVDVDIMEEKYRYLMIEFLESKYGFNKFGYIMCSEIEILVEGN